MEEDKKEVVEEIPGALTEEEAKKILGVVMTDEKRKAFNVKNSGAAFHGGLTPQGPSKIGVTRKNKKLSKKAEKIAKNSRKKNRK